MNKKKKANKEQRTEQGDQERAVETSTEEKTENTGTSEEVSAVQQRECDEGNVPKWHILGWLTGSNGVEPLWPYKERNDLVKLVGILDQDQGKDEEAVRAWITKYGVDKLLTEKHYCPDGESTVKEKLQWCNSRYHIVMSLQYPSLWQAKEGECSACT